IHDQAMAMACYARQAKNRDLEADATELRMRATRRLDEIRQAQKATVGLAKGGGGKHGRKRVAEKPTLKDAGIDKNLAHQARQLGALSEQEFEQKVAEARDAVTDAVAKVVKSKSTTTPSQEAVTAGDDDRFMREWPEPESDAGSDTEMLEVGREAVEKLMAEKRALEARISELESEIEEAKAALQAKQRPPIDESPEEHWQRSLTALADEVVVRTTYHWPDGWKTFGV